MKKIEEEILFYNELSQWDEMEDEITMSGADRIFADASKISIGEDGEFEEPASSIFPDSFGEKQSLAGNHEPYYQNNAEADVLNSTRENSITAPATEFIPSEKEVFPEGFAYPDNSGTAILNAGFKGEDIDIAATPFFNKAENSISLFGTAEKKEVSVHNEIAGINIEFSGTIDNSVDIDSLMREMKRRLKEEMASGSDFSYAF